MTDRSELKKSFFQRAGLFSRKKTSINQKEDNGSTESVEKDNNGNKENGLDRTLSKLFGENGARNINGSLNQETTNKSSSNEKWSTENKESDDGSSSSDLKASFPSSFNEKASPQHLHDDGSDTLSSQFEITDNVSDVSGRATDDDHQQVEKLLKGYISFTPKTDFIRKPKGSHSRMENQGLNHSAIQNYSASCNASNKAPVAGKTEEGIMPVSRDDRRSKDISSHYFPTNDHLNYHQNSDFISTDKRANISNIYSNDSLREFHNRRDTETRGCLPKEKDIPISKENGKLELQGMKNNSSNSSNSSMTNKISIEELYESHKQVLEQVKSLKRSQEILERDLELSKKEIKSLKNEIEYLNEDIDENVYHIEKNQKSIQRINIILKAEALYRVKNTVVPKVTMFWKKFQKFMENAKEDNDIEMIEERSTNSDWSGRN